MRLRWENLWFPALIGAMIIGAFIASMLERGYYTGPFNSVVYLPSPEGTSYAAVCLILLALSVLFLERLEKLRPAKVVQAIFFLMIITGFIAVIVAAAPLIPSLLGDGYITIDLDGPIIRLRTVILRVASGCYEPWLRNHPSYQFQRFELTMPVVSIGFGLLYILVALFLVLRSERSFFYRLSGLAYFAFFPTVINFTGYWDSYSILVVCLTTFFVFVFLAASKKSFAMAIAALGALILAIWDKPLALIALLYPFGWLMFKELDRRRLGRVARIIIPALAATVLLIAGVMVLISGVPFASFGADFEFAQELQAGIAEDGLVATIYYPLHIILPLILPLIALGLALLFSRRSRRRLARSLSARAAFWGALVVSAAYYLLQLLNPVAVWGSLDFLVHTGTLGALLAVPIFITISAVSKRWVPSLAVLCLFITVPHLALQTRPSCFARLENILASERCRFGPLLDNAIWRLLDYPGPAGKEYACGMLIQGPSPELNPRRFEPLKSYYVILEDYASGREETGRVRLHDYLRSRPRILTFLLAVKPHRSVELAPPRIFADVQYLAAELFSATGDEIYLGLKQIAGELQQEQLFICPDQDLAAVLTWLDYQKYPGTPRPDDEVVKRAEEALRRVDLLIGK